MGAVGTEVAKGCKSINIFSDFTTHMNEGYTGTPVAPK